MHGAGQRRAPRDAEWAGGVKLVLARHWRDPLSLDEIARMVHCSPFHLARVFRRETGLPIHQYRNQLRLRGALERMTDPRADLSGIALDVGFSSHSHLTSAFRAAFGVSPSQFRSTVPPRKLAQMSRNLKARPVPAS